MALSTTPRMVLLLAVRIAFLVGIAILVALSGNRVASALPGADATATPQHTALSRPAAVPAQ